MGSLQIFNALNSYPVGKPTSKGLLYVEAQINDKLTQVVVDTRSNHNFMAEDEALRLSVKCSRRDGWMKSVNAKVQPVNGIARGLRCVWESWSGMVNQCVVLGEFLGSLIHFDMADL